jgi:hypothetical protein
MREGAKIYENKKIRQPSFMAHFTQETEKDIAYFYWKKHYRMKLIVTAKDFVKVEQEFNLIFSDEGTFCRFTLVKLIENKG